MAIANNRIVNYGAIVLFFGVLISSCKNNPDICSQGWPESGDVEAIKEIQKQQKHANCPGSVAFPVSNFETQDK